MSKFYHSVYIEPDRCKGCITCLKRCPTQAIRIKDGKAKILKEFCIDCGVCTQVCPHHAKRVRRDKKATFFEKFKYTVALPAPTLYTQFNNLTDTNIILTALKLYGFDDVFEVSAGAELVTAETKRFLEDNKNYPYISTACPTIIRLIRVSFPNLIDKLLPILPPMEVAAKIARKRAVKDTGLAPEDIGIIFITPCPSKVAFIHSPLGIEKSNVDECIGIKDIYPDLLNHMKKAEKNIEQLSISGKIGKGWATSGGECYGLGVNDYLAVDGIENVIRVLENLEDDKFQFNLKFVELNSCNAGCIGGCLTVENPYLSRTKMHKLTMFEPEIVAKNDEIAKCFPFEYGWTNEVEFEPVYSLGTNFFESMQNMEKVDEILEKLPGIDCGVCGNPTCKSFAEDMVIGKFELSFDDCIYNKNNCNEN